MRLWQTYIEQFEERSSPIWRWMAAFLILCNIFMISISLIATFVPSIWAEKEPGPNFLLVATALFLLQMTPFARSTALSKNANGYDDMDEFERAIGQKVATNAYQTTGLSFMFILLLLYVAQAFADVRLTAMSGSYWLTTFALYFYSMPTIFGAFAVKSGPDTDDGDD